MSLSPLKIILPFYHAVSDEPLPHIKNLYSVRSIDQFKNDLDQISSKYRPVDLFELRDIIKNNRKEERVFHLSFDDGLSQCHDIIAPILKQKGVPATFFLNSAFIDNNDLFYRFKASLLSEALYSPVIQKSALRHLSSLLQTPDLNPRFLKDSLLSINHNEKDLLDKAAGILNVDFKTFLNKTKPYLSIEQASNLKKQGFTLGAHSIDHPYFYLIDEQEQLRQLKESLNYISGMLQLDYKVFSFPFTDYKVKASFFKKVFTPGKPLADMTFGSAGFKKEDYPYHLQRLPMEKRGNSASDIIGMETWMYNAKKLIGKHRIKR